MKTIWLYQYYFPDQRPRRYFCFLARVCLVGMLIACILFSSSHARAEDDTSLEYRVKAAFLLNFCKFVTWPETSDQASNAPLILSVLGESPFGDTLNALIGKQVRGREIQIQYASNLKKAKGSHLIFISNSMKDRLDDIISQLKGVPALTVGDMENFTQRGGMINFFMHKNKIRFEINPQAARAANIEISSQLLKIAKISGQE